MGDLEEKNKELALHWIGPAPDGCGPMNVALEGLDLLAEDAVWVMPPSSDIPGRKVRGRKAIAKIRELAATIYDISTIQNQVQDILAEGDFVTVRWVPRATFERIGMGLTPTRLTDVNLK